MLRPPAPVQCFRTAADRRFGFDSRRVRHGWRAPAGVLLHVQERGSPHSHTRSGARCPTVPASIQSTRPTSPMTSSAKGRTFGPQPRLVEHLARESGPQSKPIEGKGNHARYVGIRLFQRDARLQPRDTAVAEVSDAHLGTIEPEQQQHGRIGAQELEEWRENADHPRTGCQRCSRFGRSRREPPNRRCQ